MKIYFQKQGPRVIHYRDSKSFNIQSFYKYAFANTHEENVNINQRQKFLDVLKKVFDIHGPIKKCYTREIFK